LFGIAPAIAPIIGGALLGFGWQSIFIFLALYAAITLWATVKFLPETMPPEKRLKLSAHNVLASYKTIFSDAEFAKLCISLGAVFAGFFVYVLASPMFLGKLLGFSPQQYGYFFVSSVTGMIIGSYLSRRTAGKYAAKRVLKVAYTWMCAIVLLNVAICYALPIKSVPANPIYYIFPIALFNIGMGLVMPIISIAALDRHPKIRGTAASGQAFVQMLFSTVSAGIIVPLVWSSVFGLASAMLGFWLVSWLAITQTKLWKG
jgi:MFS transporter, DHA1 family, multidrug resistance protein